jgi:hypothetical protein
VVGQFRVGSKASQVVDDDTTREYVFDGCCCALRLNARIEAPAPGERQDRSDRHRSQEASARVRHCCLQRTTPESCSLKSRRCVSAFAVPVRASFRRKRPRELYSGCNAGASSWPNASTRFEPLNEFEGIASGILEQEALHRRLQARLQRLHDPDNCSPSTVDASPRYGRQPSSPSRACRSQPSRTPVLPSRSLSTSRRPSEKSSYIRDPSSSEDRRSFRRKCLRWRDLG